MPFKKGNRLQGSPPHSPSIPPSRPIPPQPQPMWGSTSFYCLEELNQALRDYLYRLSCEVMKDYGVSRNQRFEEEKKH